MSADKRRIVGIALCGTLLFLSFGARALAAEPAEMGGSSLTPVFYTINFVVFVVLLVKYATPSVRNYFLVRARTISSAFAHLEGALREAREQAKQAAARLEQLASEKAQIEALLRRRTEHEVQALVKGARSLADQIRRDGEVAARSAAEAAERQFRAVVAQRAAQTARELLRDHLGPADQRRLVEDFVGQMPRPQAG